LHLPYQLFKCHLAGLFLLGASAVEGGAGAIALVEATTDLSVYCGSEPALDRIGDERRKLGSDQRHAYHRNEDERGGCGKAPENDFCAQPSLNATGSVDR